ncbi:hypothetical protein CF15_06805 [Pyrodictium occultum]|uniref:Uncharacterized protein n=1 Tax=Pyrodictium occultum TaxID=2309 RepID=A0A0V8RWJ3_PYROC|nr:hypothetical protein [Pyrodictium occultum]KSW12430.1 hypothetical protein CF15_06805 [Pyrodictium occultum]
MQARAHRTGLLGAAALSVLALLLAATLSPLLAPVALAENGPAGNNTNTTTTNTTNSNVAATASTSGNTTAAATNTTAGAQLSPGAVRALLLAYSAMIRSTLARMGLLNATPAEIAAALNVSLETAETLKEALNLPRTLGNMTSQQAAELLQKVASAYRALAKKMVEANLHAAEEARERIQRQMQRHLLLRISHTVEQLARQLNDTQLAALAQQLRSMALSGNYTRENLTSIMSSVVARIEAAKIFMMATTIDNATIAQLVEAAEAGNATSLQDYLARLNKSFAKSLHLVKTLSKRLRAANETEVGEALEEALERLEDANETVGHVALAASIAAGGNATANATAVIKGAVAAAFQARIEKLETKISILMEEASLLENATNNTIVQELVKAAKDALAKASRLINESRAALEKGEIPIAAKDLGMASSLVAKAGIYLARANIAIALGGRLHGHLGVGKQGPAKHAAPPGLSKALERLQRAVQERIAEASRAINKTMEAVQGINNTKIKEKAMEKLEEAREKLEEAIDLAKEAQEKLAEGSTAAAFQLYQKALVKIGQALNDVRVASWLASLGKGFRPPIPRLPHEHEKHGGWIKPGEANVTGNITEDIDELLGEAKELGQELAQLRNETSANPAAAALVHRASSMLQSAVALLLQAKELAKKGQTQPAKALINVAKNMLEKVEHTLKMLEEKLKHGEHGGGGQRGHGEHGEHGGRGRGGHG